MAKKDYTNIISEEEIKQMPKAVFAGEIIVIDDFAGQNRAAKYLSEHQVIGIDTESRASFKKGVVNQIALLQLYAGEKAFLIRLNKVKLSRNIIALLTSEQHYKIGVALHDDIKELNSLFNFDAKNFIDLQKVVIDFGITELSLKKIVAITLNMQLSKAQRLSNWEAQNLTESQLSYAATDAWVCHRVFTELELINNKALIEKATVKKHKKKNNSK